MKKNPVLSLIYFAQITALLLLLNLTVTFIASAAVDLKFFEAEQVDTDQEVELNWETGTEDNTALFFILRANSAEGLPEPHQMNQSIIQDAIFVLYNGNTVQTIEAAGTASTGFDYFAIDTDVEYEETYFYLLVEVELSGQVIGHHDKITSVTVRRPNTKIFIPLVNK